MERKATPRQVAYIERLSSGNGPKTEKPLSELTMSEASELIQQIAAKGNGNGTQESKNNRSKKGNLNQGAFKCCYLLWTGTGHSVSEHKEQFIKHVLDVYGFINEIAEKAAEVA